VSALNHGDERQAQLFTTLVELLALDPGELQRTLDQASTLITRALDADLTDIFLYEVAAKCLVAVGLSDSALRTRQRAAGFNRLLLADGGLTVGTFRDGGSYRTGNSDQEVDERQDIVEALQLLSTILCRIESDSTARGVVQAASLQRDWFSPLDVRFLEAAGHWIGLVLAFAERAPAITIAAAPPRDSDSLGRLTTREQEVAALVARGLTNEQVAEQLVLVPGTAANHVQHILHKLGFTRRAQIAAWAVRYGLWAPEAQ
jgi:DNA-binding CsgD family transcriptional regulator